jgi:hypothetical protein
VVARRSSTKNRKKQQNGQRGRKRGVWSQPLDQSIRPANADTIRKWRENVRPAMTREELHHALAAHIHPPSLSTIRKWEINQAELTLSHLQAMELVKPGLVRMLFG